MIEFGKEKETDWENIDFSIFDGLENSKDVNEYVRRFLEVCKENGYIKPEFLPLRQTLDILDGSGLLPFDRRDVDDAYLNQALQKTGLEDIVIENILKRD